MSGLAPAPAVDGCLEPLTLRPTAYSVVRRHSKLAAFRRLQDERDGHAARCPGRGGVLPPRPCPVLRMLDERLRLEWAEVEFLGGDLAELYEPRPCAPECEDCEPAAECQGECGECDRADVAL